MALSLAGPPLTSLLGSRHIIMVKGRNAFSCARSYVAFVYPVPWPEEGVGTLHILPENISSVRQNICHPTQRILQILTIEPWKGEHRKAS